MSEIPDQLVEDLTPNLASNFESLSGAAGTGDVAAQREMIATCRDYLLYIANQELATEVLPKCAPSDIVQNTMMRAVEKYSDFRGENQRQLLAWLRQILLNEIHDVGRHFLQADKRDIRREKSLAGDTNSSAIRPELSDADLTPSSDAAAREEAARLRTALLKLSEDHQEVLRLRNWEQLKFSEIAERMQRSETAAKKLWGRAVDALEKALRS
jgi:RNA polymerase sigma-70 factor (ECF subfamily)